MSELQTNDDGTVTLPLRGKEPITIPEPSAMQLVRAMQLVDAVDQSLPPNPTITQDSTPAELQAATAKLRDRHMATYSDAAPYGNALIQLVKVIADVDITLDDLPGWALAPQTCRSILAHFQNPSPGADLA
jgi:hypothetical protein